jgi:hypothetical protein
LANVVEIVIKQTGSGNAIADAGKALGGLGGAAKGVTGMLGGFGGALGNVATIAGGIVAANIFGKIVDGITGFVTTGLDAVSSSQQLESSLKALLTANNMYSQTTETVTQAITKQVMSEEELGFKHDELTAKLATQKAAYQEQQQRIIDLTAAYGENGLNVIKAKAQHDQLSLSIQATERDIAGLTATETEYTTSTRSAWQQTMDQASAFKIASKETADLLDFVSRLAVVSPFETADVELTTKYAIAAGLGVNATKDFVPAFLDLAGAVGITSDSLGFAADQLFQVKKIGKLTEVDLRQLRRLGIDLAKVIGVEMGMSVEEFNKKAETTPEIFDELFSAVTRFSQNTFAGTAKEMATSVKGLKSTFSDIFVIGARTFLRPLVDAATPAVAAIATAMSDFVFSGDVEGLGQQLADLFTQGMGLGFEGSVTAVFNFLFEQIAGLIVTYWPIVQAQLFIWRDNFFAWVNELYPQIPGILTGLVTGLSTAISENWPVIQAALSEWSIQFWGWATEAAMNVGQAMGAIAAALVAWAMSSEAQAAMNDLGQNLGVMLFDALGLAAQSSEGTSSVMASLLSGLVVAVAGLTASLIILGGTVVAGIVQGILEKMGIEVEPATFNELSAILTGIGANIATVAALVGNSIVTGISDGISAAWATIQTTIGELATSIMAWFADPLGIASPSTVFFQFGTDLIQGLIDGIYMLAAGLPAVIQEIAGSLLESGANLFSSIFGGGEEGTGFDPTAMLAGLESIRIFLAETIPASVLLLGETFTAFFLNITTQITALTAGPLTMFITTMSTIYLIHLPLLVAVWTSSTAQIVAQITTTTGTVNVLIGAITQANAAAVAMAAAIVSGMKRAGEAFEEAGDKIKDLISVVKEAAEEFKSMAEAAREAAAASKSAGSSSGQAGGLGFAGGTGPLGFLVPPGFPNDSFPLRVQSGERVVVSPSGRSIEDVTGAGRTTNNYFNMTVNSRADSSSVVNDFRVMQMLLGA